MIINNIKKVNRLFTRLDDYLYRNYVRHLNPMLYRPQVTSVWREFDRWMTVLDRAIVARVTDATSIERRQQFRQFAVTFAGHVGDMGRRARAGLRRPESHELVALREDAAALSARFRLMLKRSASGHLSPGCVGEITRWNSLMALEASGGAAGGDETVREVAKQLGGEDAMRAGDRALMCEVRDIAVKRDLYQLVRSLLLAVMEARMTLSRIRHLRGEISPDALAWELMEARENLRLYLVEDAPKVPDPRPFSDLRAAIESMPHRRDRDQAAA